MTSSSQTSSSKPIYFSNLPSVFDEVLERVVVLSNSTDLLQSSSHSPKKRKSEDKQLLSPNLLRSCDFKKVLHLIQTTIDSILFKDQNSIIQVDRAYQNIIDNVKSSNNEIKVNISRQSFIIGNQMNPTNALRPSPRQFNGTNAKHNYQDEFPDLKVNQHKKEKVDARISTTTAEIQYLEAENARLLSQINQLASSKPPTIENFNINSDIDEKINQIKFLKDKNIEIEKALQSQQRNSSIIIQKERQEIDRFLRECEAIQSQVSSLENRIELMSARSLKQNINQVPSINTAVLSKKSLQANIVPPQKKAQKRQRIVFRKPALRPKAVLPSLQPSSDLPVNQDMGLMEEIAKNALLSAGDTMTTVATVTNVATASSSSQSAFDNRSSDDDDVIDNDDSKPLIMHGNFNRKRRKTIGPSPYDIIESSSFDGSIYPHSIDSLDNPEETNEEEAHAAGIVGDDTCFYECPPNTEPSREIRLKPMPPSISQDMPSENISKNGPSIKKNPSLASNLSRTSSSEPQPQKTTFLPGTNSNNSRPNSVSSNSNSNSSNPENNGNSKEPIKICTRSPLTDDLLRLPMPSAHMQNLLIMQTNSSSIANNGDINNENENGEVPILLSKMPIMVRNSAEFFSRNNSEKRNTSPYDGDDDDESNDGEKSINDLNELDRMNNNNNADVVDDRSQKVDNRDVTLNAENPPGFQIKEPNLGIDHLANTDRAPRPKPGINQM
ncbi:hypothetical protein M9Y10_013627 [Tritrichomonas musculus]|uniref:Uncharacterized protein n=1 Tax=Tritrichomonas musculus TaxID=1915356 RepID=A0ABR2KY13_9EUKA